MPSTPTHPSLHYEVHGTTGTGVLLIMGLGMRGRIWQPQLADLSRHHRCLIFDSRGIGDSETASSMWRMQDLADDALRVLEAVGWDRVHLVGTSMGGMVAQELALTQPHRFLSLSLIATHAGGRLNAVPPKEGLQKFVEAQSADPEKRVAAILDLLYPPGWLAEFDSSMLRQHMRERVGRPAPPKTIARQIYAIARHDTRERLRQIRQPTLVVKPELDILVAPGNSDVLADQIPGARLVTFPDAGHGVVFQRASDLNRHLLDHFRGAEA